jgi:hypothetical protein
MRFLFVVEIDVDPKPLAYAGYRCRIAAKSPTVSGASIAWSVSPQIKFQTRCGTRENTDLRPGGLCTHLAGAPLDKTTGAASFAAKRAALPNQAWQHTAEIVR